MYPKTMKYLCYSQKLKHRKLEFDLGSGKVRTYSFGFVSNIMIRSIRDRYLFIRLDSFGKKKSWKQNYNIKLNFELSDNLTLFYKQKFKLRPQDL